jgi:hypothetical protein
MDLRPIKNSIIGINLAEIPEGFIQPSYAGLPSTF